MRKTICPRKRTDAAGELDDPERFLGKVACPSLGKAGGLLAVLPRSHGGQGRRLDAPVPPAGGESRWDASPANWSAA